MAITFAGTTLPVPVPIAGNEVFFQNFFSMLDIQPSGIGSTLTITSGKSGAIYKWDTAAGSTATLPAATGSSMRIVFYVSVLATTNSHIVKTSPSTDIFQGIIMGARTDSGNAVLGFAGQSTSNTITLNRSTTGSVNIGEWVEVFDAASGIWLVRGMLSATGAAFATPFSHV